MTSEDRVKGKLSNDVYWDYIKMNGGRPFLFVVITA